MRNIGMKLVRCTEGLTAEKIALMVVLGFVLGTFPLIGFPTILCGLAALAFRVNLPGLQLINQIATPAQLVLLAPLSRAGTLIFGFHGGFSVALLNAVAAWCVFCIPTGALLYAVTMVVLRRRKFATPVHPVWWLAPRPAPLPPWKYS